MSRRKNVLMVAAGILVGTMLTGPAAHAAAEYLTAIRSTQTFYLNGQQIEMESYIINGNNYVKLRDIGEAVDFNVYWNGTVQIDSGSPYTGEAPAASGVVALPTDGSRYVPQVGDIIRCDDGSDYTITDVSRWDKNMFASGPLPELPEPTCDWSSFPAVKLPAPEARRFQLDTGDYLFVRNLYETRRMQHTLQNLAGNHPDTSENGMLKYGSKGTPAVQINLTIDDSLSAQSFWPWRESELENLFNSCPPGTYSVEAWDVYKDGEYLYTEYKVHVI